MGSRQEAAQESCVQRQTLDDPDLCAALRLFSQLLSSSMGPHGRIQSVQNNVGGPITMTTASSRLLSAMSFTQPCLRLIVSAVQGHLQSHHDGGLITGSLCLRLVLNAVDLESVGRKSVREVYETLLKLADDFLNSNQCPVSVNVDTANVKVMLAYVRAFFASKPVCGLRRASAEFMSQLVLKTFLNSLPDSPQPFLSDRVLTLQFEKTDAASSEVMEGLLLEWPEKPNLFGAQSVPLMGGRSGEVIRVAVVTVSMSGDAEEFPTNRVEADQLAIESAAERMMERLSAFCDALCRHGVGVLLCQKVIHPKVKEHLRRRGLVFVERLGIQPIAYIQDLTGASPITSVLVAPDRETCGVVDSVRQVVVHNKSYLHLQRARTCVCTLLLCGAAQQNLTEIKSQVQSAMKGLYSLLQRPVALCGGGCWQVHLACFVRQQVKEREKELCSDLQVTAAQLQSAADAFASSLEACALSLLDPSFSAWVDANHRHFWSAPPGVDIVTETSRFSCACGLLAGSDVDRNSLLPLLGGVTLGVGQEEEGGLKGRLSVGEEVPSAWLVLDGQETAVSAVRTAVMTAVTVLSISQYIHDVN